MSKTATVTFVGTDIEDTAKQIIYTLSEPLDGYHMVVVSSAKRDPYFGWDIPPSTQIYPASGGGAEKSDWSIDWDRTPLADYDQFDQDAVLAELGYEVAGA